MFTEDVAIETQGRRWTLETSGNGPKKENPLHLNMETTQKKSHDLISFWKHCNFVAIKYFASCKVPTQKYCIYVLNYSATNFERQEKKL